MSSYAAWRIILLTTGIMVWMWVGLRVWWIRVHESARWYCVRGRFKEGAQVLIQMQKEMGGQFLHIDEKILASMNWKQDGGEGLGMGRALLSKEIRRPMILLPLIWV